VGIVIEETPAVKIVIDAGNRLIIRIFKLQNELLRLAQGSHIESDQTIGVAGEDHVIPHSGIENDSRIGDIGIEFQLVVIEIQTMIGAEIVSAFDIALKTEELVMYNYSC
jgi:hypothetical protein